MSGLCVSLRWVGSMLPSDHAAINLLMDPLTSEGHLCVRVVKVLTHPGTYCSLLTRILPKERPFTDFSALVHKLARHGVFMTEEVNSSSLEQTKPFRQASHLAVMEGLMTLYTRSIVTLPAIVKTVRRVCKLVASKDLPGNVSEGLLLWLNKMPLVRTPAPTLTEALCGGQALATLLLHYTPKAFKVSDFHLGKSLSPQQGLDNVSKAVLFLNHHLERPGFHILPEELHESTSANITALVAHLYHCLENKHCSRTSLRSTSDTSLNRHTVFKAPLKGSMSSHDLITADALPPQTVTVFKAPLRGSMSSHDLITADALPPQTFLQPRLSITRHKTSAPPSEELRRSFTVSTHQTAPAGLPVIGPSDDPGKEEIHLSIYPPTKSPTPSTAQPSDKLTQLLAVYERIKERDHLARENTKRLFCEFFDKEDNGEEDSDTSLSKFPFSPIQGDTTTTTGPTTVGATTTTTGPTTVEATTTTGPTTVGATTTTTGPVGATTTTTGPVGATTTTTGPVGATTTTGPVGATTTTTGPVGATTTTTGPTPEDNPWTQGDDELLRQQREAGVRARLTERDRVRRVASVERRHTGSVIMTHNGPQLYIAPRAKSNKKLIKNAISFVCLAGEPNLSAKQSALVELEACSASHVMVLFRDIIGFKFRGLYSYSPDSDQVVKLFGNGPKVIKSAMVDHLYKYYSGRKEFREVPTKALSVSVDALTIQPECWAKKGRK